MAHRPWASVTVIAWGMLSDLCVTGIPGHGSYQRISWIDIQFCVARSLDRPGGSMYSPCRARASLVDARSVGASYRLRSFLNSESGRVLMTSLGPNQPRRA